MCGGNAAFLPNFFDNFVYCYSNKTNSIYNPYHMTSSTNQCQYLVKQKHKPVNQTCAKYTLQDIGT